MAFGVDYAWGRPSVTSLKNAGVIFVCRYLSHDTTGKTLDHAEAVRLSNAGIWVVVVWEDTARRALAGWDAGVQDAKEAAKQAKAAGMPPDRPIFFAVDFDASAGQQAAINAYLDGAASVITKKRTGIYGGYNPVKRALDGEHCTWAWQTYAWSGGKWDPRAQIQQYLNDQTIGGVGLDHNRTTKSDYGQWKVGVTPTPPPPPAEEDEDMPTGVMKPGTDPKDDLTVQSIAQGRYSRIALGCDNGFQGLQPASVRVAMWGGGHWKVEHNQVIASGKDPVVIPLPAGCTHISLHHENADEVAKADKGKVDTAGAVLVSYAVS